MKKGICMIECMITICALLLLSGCNQSYTINELYSITANEDLTYDYVIKDKNNNILISDKGVSKEPKVSIINEDVLSISVQTGTGISTRWTMYCDVNSGTVSDAYYSVLGEHAENVVFVNQDNGTYSIVVQNFFDKEQYHISTVLANASQVTDPVVSFEKLSDAKAKVIYLRDEDYIETETTIEL